jgi:hypothetical protein
MDGVNRKQAAFTEKNSLFTGKLFEFTENSNRFTGKMSQFTEKIR